MKRALMAAVSLSLLFVLGGCSGVPKQEASSSSPPARTPPAQSREAAAPASLAPAQSQAETASVPSVRDFNFRLSYGVDAKNCVDTYGGKIVKDLIMDGTATADFTIPPDAMQSIQSEFLRDNIDALPAAIDIGSAYCMPPNSIELTYTCGGCTGTIRCESGFWNEADAISPDNKALLRFAKFVRDYIEQTDAYKGLPPISGGYD